MKKKLRRTLAILLAAIMLISAFPVVNAFATKKGKLPSTRPTAHSAR